MDPREAHTCASGDIVCNIKNSETMKFSIKSKILNNLQVNYCTSINGKYKVVKNEQILPIQSHVYESQNSILNNKSK
jgi:hypothetical protein